MNIPDFQVSTSCNILNDILNQFIKEGEQFSGLLSLNGDYNGSMFQTYSEPYFITYKKKKTNKTNKTNKNTGESYLTIGYVKDDSTAYIPLIDADSTGTVTFTCNSSNDNIYVKVSSTSTNETWSFYQVKN